MLPYVNIHTHRPTGSGIELRTAGVHPWDADMQEVAALRETPLSQLFLETDDSPVPIAAVYARAAEARGIPVEELQRATLANYERIFETQHG